MGAIGPGVLGNAGTVTRALADRLVKEMRSDVSSSAHISVEGFPQVEGFVDGADLRHCVIDPLLIGVQAKTQRRPRGASDAGRWRINQPRGFGRQVDGSGLSQVDATQALHLGNHVTLWKARPRQPGQESRTQP